MGRRVAACDVAAQGQQRDPALLGHWLQGGARQLRTAATAPPKHSSICHLILLSVCAPLASPHDAAGERAASRECGYPLPPPPDGRSTAATQARGWAEASHAQIESATGRIVDPSVQAGHREGEQGVVHLLACSRGARDAD